MAETLYSTGTTILFVHELCKMMSLLNFLKKTSGTKEDNPIEKHCNTQETMWKPYHCEEKRKMAGRGFGNMGLAVHKMTTITELDNYIKYSLWKVHINLFSLYLGKYMYIYSQKFVSSPALLLHV